MLELETNRANNLVIQLLEDRYPNLVNNATRQVITPFVIFLANRCKKINSLFVKLVNSIFFCRYIFYFGICYTVDIKLHIILQLATSGAYKNNYFSITETCWRECCRNPCGLWTLTWSWWRWTTWATWSTPTRHKTGPSHFRLILEIIWQMKRKRICSSIW